MSEEAKELEGGAGGGGGGGGLARDKTLLFRASFTRDSPAKSTL